METSSIEQVIRDFQYAYMSAISDSNHSATGNLALNQQYRINFDGQYFTITLLLEDYWKYLEYGRRAGRGFPPIDAIRKWIRVKPVLPRPMEISQEQANRNLAFIIGKKIKEENGYRPPTEALLKWMGKKGIYGRTTIIPTENQLAYLIARGIQKNGIQPTNLLNDTINNFGLVQRLLNAVQTEYQKEINKQVNKDIENELYK